MVVVVVVVVVLATFERLVSTPAEPSHRRRPAPELISWLEV
jgi:hypothetical protein